MGEAARWAIGLVLGVPSALLLVCNWGGMVGAFRAGRSYSFARPWLCGLVGSVACLACPFPGVRDFAGVPLVLDPSIVLPLIAMIFLRAANPEGPQSGSKTAAQRTRCKSRLSERKAGGGR